MKFSVVVVALNPGEKLNRTLESIFGQTYADYEVILKDGGSKDGSVDVWRPERMTAVPYPEARSAETGAARSAAVLYGRAAADRVRFFDESDRSIYDAMNQAVSHARGEYILFLNCGDLFADEKVLERTAAVIDRERAEKAHGVRGTKRGEGQHEEADAAGRYDGDKEAGENEGESCGERTVLYGDTLSEKNGVVIASAPEITGFTCYRNIPCHQSCFYSADLCREKPYDPEYKIRADYDHFLWCFYRAGAKMVPLGFPVSSYEGGGYSESRENAKRDKQEHREITEKYMAKTELFRYKLIMALTLAPLRRFMAENKAFSGIYHWVKEKVYCRR